MRKSTNCSFSRVTFALVGLSTCWLGASCSGDSGEKEPLLRVGLVTEDGRVDDNTFTQGAWEGGLRAVQELGIQIDYSGPSEFPTFAGQFDHFISEGRELIISVGFLTADATLAAATAHAATHFASVDSSFGTDGPSNLAGLLFREDQVGFMAGALAGKMSTSKVVGCVGGVDIPPVKRLCNGLSQGVAFACPTCTTRITYTMTWDNQIKDGSGAVIASNVGEDAADAFVADGADVIFGAGGLTGSLAIKHAAQGGTWVIGVDLDEYKTTFRSGAESGAQKVLSSAMKRVDEAVFQVIKSAAEGRHKGGDHFFSYANQGVGLAPFHDADSSIPADIKQFLATTETELADGSRETGIVFATGDVVVP